MKNISIKIENESSNLDSKSAETGFHLAYLSKLKSNKHFLIYIKLNLFVTNKSQMEMGTEVNIIILIIEVLLKL